MSMLTTSIRGRVGVVLVLMLAAAACRSAGATKIAPLAAPTSPHNPIVAVAPPTAAETIAYQYMATRDQADTELAAALFAEDPIVIDSPIAAFDRQPAVFELFEILDWRWTVQECDEIVSEPPVEVACIYTTANVWSEALGVAPVDGQIRFGVANGRIVEMYHDFNRAAWETDVERLFRSWLANTHPEDVGSMWETEGFPRVDDYEAGFGERLVPRLTDESLELFERYADEFAADVG